MKDTERLREIWADFVYDGIMDESVPEPIADSWRKCKEAGVGIDDGSGRHIDKDVLERVRKANRTLIDAALPVMQSVFDIVKQSSYLIVLTDSVGYLLETMGDEEIINRSEDLRFMPGAMWSNLEVGTNAISLALDYDAAIQTVGAQHYCISHQGWTCSAAPIHGLSGEIIGCVNMSGAMDTCSDHTLGLVKIAAQSIENEYRIRYSSAVMNAVIDSIPDAAVLMDSEYRPYWMNSKAKTFFSLDGGCKDIKTKDFRRFFPGINWQESHWDVGDKYVSDSEPVVIGGQTFFCGLTITPLVEYGRKTLCLTLSQNRLDGSEYTEAMEIKEIISECRGNVDEAAKKLKISKSTLYRKLKKWE